MRGRKGSKKVELAWNEDLSLVYVDNSLSSAGISSGEASRSSYD